MACYCCLHVCILLYFFCISSVVSNDDFYNVLGVNRDANNDEIKKAYRQLAKQWHPDKNTDSEAQAKFIKINEAYQTLSDPQTRDEYDRYGHTGTPNNYQREHQSFQNSEFMFFNGMPFQFQSNWKHRDFTTFNYFKKTILPESFSKPYLIQVVSDWCIKCAAVEDIWEFTSKELKSLGIGTARVNRNMEPGLVKELDVRQWPSFLGVINGKRYQYSGTVTVENLREFVSGLFPKYLAREVTSSSISSFLHQWYDDNKPRGILLTSKTSPPLLLKILAFKYHQHFVTGYVQVTKPENEDLVEKYGAGKYEPCFVIYKENVTQPEVVLKGSDLKSGSLGHAISENLYLNFPRLSSQNVFQELCPRETSLSMRSLCVVYFTDDSPKFLKRHALLRMSKDRTWMQKKIRFAYVKKGGQPALSSALKMNEKTRSVCPNKKMSNKVAILWPIKHQEIKYIWLEDGWCTSRDVSRLTSLLNKIYSGKVKLELTAVLPELHNEHQSIQKRLFGYWDNMIYYIFHYINWSESLTSLSLVMTLAFVFLVSYLLPNKSESDDKSTSGEPKTDIDVYGLVQLNSSNQTNLLNSKNGQSHLLIVLLSDASSHVQATRSPIVQAFAKISKQYSKETIFKFGWLSLPTHIVWCNEVMKVQTFGEITPGTVLAINGAKKYLSTFKIQQGNKVENDNLFEDTEDEEMDNSSVVFQEDKRTQKRLAQALEEQFPRWIEKLYEGMLPRVKLENWPKMESDL